MDIQRGMNYAVSVGYKLPYGVMPGGDERLSILCAHEYSRRGLVDFLSTNLTPENNPYAPGARCIFTQPPIGEVHPERNETTDRGGQRQAPVSSVELCEVSQSWH